MKKFLFAALAVAVTLVACDNVGSLTKKGVEAFDQGKYEEAIEYFNKAIEKDPQKAGEANRMLGIIYADTVGGVKDAKKAFEYFTAATELGDSIGIYLLAKAYDNGDGTVQNLEKASQYYTKAADAGYPQAMAEAGWLYMRGYKGVTKDETKAVKYLKDAVEAKNADAMAYLAYAYENGKGVDKDEAKALELYSLAAESGSADGKALLGYTYAYGYLGVVPNTTKGIELIKASVEENSSLGMRYMGHLYSNNKITTNDVDGYNGDAIYWYRKAAEAGNVDAMYDIGWELSKNYSWDKEKLAEAVQWYQRAADQGFADAMAGLGFMYSDGKGVAKSDEKAFEWFKKGAEAGSDWAMGNLGWSYEYGHGTAKDRAKAIEWYKKAAEQGNEYSQKALKRLGVN